VSAFPVKRNVSPDTLVRHSSSPASEEGGNTRDKGGEKGGLRRGISKRHTVRRNTRLGAKGRNH